MKTLLNIIWIVLSGFWLAIGYALAGVVCCILIVTIPWGIASFRMANYVLWPFGRLVVSKPDAGSFSFIGNVIWFIFAGLWLAIGHIASGIALAITIIGIPFAIANFIDDPGFARAARQRHRVDGQQHDRGAPAHFGVAHPVAELVEAPESPSTSQGTTKGPPHFRAGPLRRL